MRALYLHAIAADRQAITLAVSVSNKNGTRASNEHSRADDDGWARDAVDAVDGVWRGISRVRCSAGSFSRCQHSRLISSKHQFAQAARLIIRALLFHYLYNVLVSSREGEARASGSCSCELLKRRFRAS